MRHTPKELITAIDRHAPRNWRRSALPEPRLLVLPEFWGYALSSSAFSQGHLWNETWAEPSVGFPIQAARQVTRAYLQAHPDKARGVIHFGSNFAAEIGRMMQIQTVPSYLAQVTDQIRLGADDVFHEAELFWNDNAVRLRFIND